MAPDLDALDGGDMEDDRADPSRGRFRHRLGLERQAVEFLAVERGQPCPEAAAVQQLLLTTT